MDVPLLYVPVTDEAIENAYTFYGIWWESPGAVKVSESGMGVDNGNGNGPWSGEGGSDKWLMADD